MSDGSVNLGAVHDTISQYGCRAIRDQHQTDLICQEVDMKQPKRRKETHPTLFVFEGTIRCYEDGSMLELHTQVQPEEWEQIVMETVKYYVFVQCLKTTGMPLLGENWEEYDDYVRVQLEVAVSRMRNIDPLLVAKFDQKALTDNYTKQMQDGAIQVDEVVTQVRALRKQSLLNGLGDNGATHVSDL